MVLTELMGKIRGRGVTLSIVGDRLRYSPASCMTPELVEGLREHKADILEALEGCESVPTSEHFDTSPMISTTAEVLELARAHFGEIAPESRQEAPYAAPEPGRDPLAHKHTDKALWFAGARERELERRRRHGLPSYIRIVDGGRTA